MRTIHSATTPGNAAPDVGDCCLVNAEQLSQRGLAPGGVAHHSDLLTSELGQMVSLPSGGWADCSTNLANPWAGNSVHLSNLFLSHFPGQRTDLIPLSARELASYPLPNGAVLHVLGLGSKLKVSRVATESVVAPVADDLVGRDFPMSDLPRHTMSARCLPVEPAAAVPAAGLPPRPLPATSRLFVKSIPKPRRIDHTRHHKLRFACAQ